MVLGGNRTAMNDSVKTQDQKISFLPSEKRYIMVTDENGNIRGCFPLKKKNLGTGWFAMYQNPAGWLAQLRLTGEQYSVLFALFNRLDFDNYLRVSRQEIAEFLNMQPVQVSRAMKKLKELEIIFEGPRAGSFKTYRLNPYVAHKGTNIKDTVIDFNAALEGNTK